MNKLLEMPLKSQIKEQMATKIHHRISANRLVRSVEKSPLNKFKDSQQTLKIRKRKSAFEIRHKSSEPVSNRYNNGEEKPQYIIRNRNKNVGAISQLFNALKRQKSSQSGKLEDDKKSLNSLKAELAHLNSNRKQLIPSSLVKKDNKSKNKLSSQRMHSKSLTESPKLIEVNHKEMKDYSQYICSEGQNYYTQINYSSIRENDRTCAFGVVNFSELNLIESINLCLIDILKESRNSNLIQEYCTVYFQNQQRIKIQVFLNYHIFKAFAAKIKTLFVYEKIFFYIAYKIGQRALAHKTLITQIIIEALKIIDLSLKAVLEGVRDFISKSSNNVMETFKSLKIVKELQKYKDRLEEVFARLRQQIDKVEDPTESVHIFKQEVEEIFGNMKPFLGQSSFYHKVEEFQSRSEIILSWKFLRIPPTPYLPTKKQDSPKYTLVIGLNQVLIYYNVSTKILKYRAFMDTFLEGIKDKFEIVLFSEFQKEITDRIVKEIEKDHKFFRYRLYKPHMRFHRGKIIKDISSIGRNLQYLVCIDSQTFQSFPENCLKISPFRPPNIKSLNSHKDEALLSMFNELLTVLEKSPEDIRSLLNKKESQLARIPQVNSLQEKSLQNNRNGYLG